MRTTGRWPAAIAFAVGLAGAAGAQGVTFTAPPAVKKDGELIRVTFTVSAPTDVEVAVLDGGGPSTGSGQGKVVRHLAAGLLGKSAPEPFKKGVLAQEITWDGKDDRGVQVSGVRFQERAETPPKPEPSTSADTSSLTPETRHRKPFSVRVRIGSRPTLDKHVGWDGNTLGGSIVGLTVGKGGELFVLLSDGYWGRSEVRVLSREGKYLRTILPYPAGTPKERAASVGQLEIDGEHFPIVFNAHGHNLSPLVNGMKPQSMAWSPKGHLLLASAVGSMDEHGPARHLLALHPNGGAPEGMGFVGPRLLPARGFLDGAGEFGYAYFDHLAVSPDDESIYACLTAVSDFFKPRHGVFRLKWSDKELAQPFLGKDEAGADDEHFDDPQGVAVDKEGNLYVCDRGNNRLLKFTAGGKLLGKLAVDYPEQIAVHPASGEIFILSRPKPDKWEDKYKMSQAEYAAYKRRLAERKKRPPIPIVLRRLGPWGNEPPKELARQELPLTLIALDPESAPPRLWGVTDKGLVPVNGKDGGFELGAPVNNTRGLDYPLFVAADPARPRVLVREMTPDLKGLPVRAIDLATGAMTTLLQAAEVVFGPDGNLYAAGGWGSNALFRYDPDGKPLPFPGSDSHKMDTGPWTAYGPNTGLRGYAVAPSGDIYHLRAINHWGIGEKGIHNRVDQFGPDGKIKQAAIVDGLGDGDCGIGVDAAGNIYVGSNVKPADRPFPAEFRGKVPDKGWLWWKKDPREPPWSYTYYNPYLFHWGSVFKFGPAGGSFYGLGVAVKPGDPKAKDFSPLVFPTNAPAGAAAYTTGYLEREVKVAGALWRYAGMGVVPTSMASAGWGDPACGCLNARLAVDPYGRVFVPNVFRFSVEMLDTAGNPLARIGRYGNADDVGPGISFAWPAFLSVAGDRLAVSDPVNRRVTVVKLDWAATADCPIP